jgi:hypothetical protein
MCFRINIPIFITEQVQKKKGKKVMEELLQQSREFLNYYKTVYRHVLAQARNSGDAQYLQQLQQGSFTENRNVREPLYMFQEMIRTAKQFEDAEYSAKLEKEFDEHRMGFVQQ